MIFHAYAGFHDNFQQVGVRTVVKILLFWVGINGAVVLQFMNAFAAARIGVIAVELQYKVTKK